MRKLFLLFTVAIIALLVLYHQRIFLRDPLGKVERNGAPVSGAQVYINYTNDVLVFENSENGGRTMFLVQNWNRLPGTPSDLKCIQFMLCVTPADRAIPGTPKPAEQATMSNREVTFTDAAGSHVRVTIR